MKKLISKEFVIGISVIVALVILFFGIDYLKGINMLSPSNFYYIDCENVSGLEVSSPVSIDGFKVGQVREISYNYEKPGKIKVLLAVNKKLRIPDNSYAELASTLMGGGYVDIKVGNSSKPLEIGSEIPVKASHDLMASISNDVMPAVNRILPRVDTLLMNLNTLVEDPALSQSIKRLDAITANVDGLTSGLNNAMQRDVPVVLRNAKSLTTKLDTVSANLIALSNSLKQLPLSTTIDNVNDITNNLSKFSDQLNNQSSTLGQLTTNDELYRKLNTVVANIDSLVVDIKKNPKRYISIKVF